MKNPVNYIERPAIKAAVASMKIPETSWLRTVSAPKYFNSIAETCGGMFSNMRKSSPSQFISGVFFASTEGGQF